MVGTGSRRPMAALFSLFIVLCLGCGEPAQDTPASARTLRQAVKPEPLCPRGERICDMDGNVRQCAGQSGLHRKNPSNGVGPIHDCDVGETCYFGECSTDLIDARVVTKDTLRDLGAPSAFQSRQRIIQIPGSLSTKRQQVEFVSIVREGLE